MVTRIQPMAIVPANISTIDDIRSGFQEIASDLGSVIDQWNSTIYPLIDSLPGGRRRLTPLDRTTQIDPVANGFDGSQVFLDLTATALVNNGILYNAPENRPKTIKEVVLDSYLETLDQIRQLRAILDQLAVDQQAFDDTNLKAWIRRLAADTVSDLNSGDTFGAGYFAGNQPTKTVQYSLHQRDVNLRNLIGIADDNFGLTNPGLSETNYIDDDTIIEALIDLDTQIKTVADGVGGVASLQSAYDNGPVIEIDHPSGNHVPVEIRGIMASLASIRSLGRLDFLDDLSDTTSGSILHTITDEGAGRFISRAFVLRGGLPGSGADVSFTYQQQSAYHSTYDLNPAGDSRSTLHLGPATSVGLTNEIYATLEGGTRTVGDGGGYRWRIYSFDDSGAQTAFEGRGPLTVSSTSLLSLTGDTVEITGTTSVTVESADITLSTTDDILISADSGVTVSGDTSTTVGGGAVTIIAGTGFGIFPTVASANCFKIVSKQHITLFSDDGDLTASAGTGYQVTIGSDAMTLELGSPLDTPGIKFTSDWSNVTGNAIYFNKTGTGTIGSIYYSPDGAADGPWLSATDDAPTLVVNTGIVKVSANAPHNISSTDYGFGGAPNISAIYKDNVVKAAGRIDVDVSKTGSITAADTSFAFNMWVDSGTKSVWNGATGELSVYFRTAMPGAHRYSITCSAGHATNIMNCRITAQTTTYFKVKVTKFDSGSFVLPDTGSGDDDFNFHFQVV